MMFDIPINFCTGYFEHGKIVLDKKKSFLHYYRESFGLDLFIVALVLLYTILQEAQDAARSMNIANYFMLLFYCKVYNFKIIYKRIEIRFKLTQRTNMYIEMCYLTVLTIFISHLFACLWVLVGRYENSMHNENWM